MQRRLTSVTTSPVGGWLRESVARRLRPADLIRAVLDTNVLASGLAGYPWSSRLPTEIIRAWRNGRLELLLSSHILAELAQTLAKPYFARRLTATQVGTVLGVLAKDATLVSLTAQVPGTASHPEDDLVLATALSASADVLVTGDRQLQRLGRLQDITILSPSQFLVLLTQGEPQDSL